MGKAHQHKVRRGTELMAKGYLKIEKQLAKLAKEAEKKGATKGFVGKLIGQELYMAKHFVSQTIPTVAKNTINVRNLFGTPVWAWLEMRKLDNEKE